MTPAEAARVLKVVDEDDVEVSASERRFCEEYFSGEFDAILPRRESWGQLRPRISGRV